MGVGNNYRCCHVKITDTKNLPFSKVTAEQCRKCIVQYSFTGSYKKPNSKNALCLCKPKTFYFICCLHAKSLPRTPHHIMVTKKIPINLHTVKEFLIKHVPLCFILQINPVGLLWVRG